LIIVFLPVGERENVVVFVVCYLEDSLEAAARKFGPFYFRVGRFERHRGVFNRECLLQEDDRK
jgi:hypothetical protein